MNLYVVYIIQSSITFFEHFIAEATLSFNRDRYLIILKSEQYNTWRAGDHWYAPQSRFSDKTVMKCTQWFKETMSDNYIFINSEKTFKVFVLRNGVQTGVNLTWVEKRPSYASRQRTKAFWVNCCTGQFPERRINTNSTEAVSSFQWCIGKTQCMFEANKGKSLFVSLTVPDHRLSIVKYVSQRAFDCNPSFIRLDDLIQHDWYTAFSPWL